MIFIDTSPRTLRTALSKFTERIRVILHGVSTYGDLLAKLKAVCMLSCERFCKHKINLGKMYTYIHDKASVQNTGAV